MQLCFTDMVFQTPTVLKIADDGFLMRHLPNAVPAYNHIPTLPLAIQENEYATIIELINRNTTGTVQFSQAPFLKKILQIISRLKSVEDIRLAERIAVRINSNGYTYYQGRYHGDYTLSNILYDGLERYLIDFTPAYIASPVMDVIKLKQEYKLEWSSLVAKVPDGYKRSICILRDFVESEFTVDTSILEAMNLLRILPYSRTGEMAARLRKNINQLL